MKNIIKNLKRLSQIDNGIDRIIKRFNVEKFNMLTEDNRAEYRAVIEKWDDIEEKLFDKRDSVIKELRSYRKLENRKDRIAQREILLNAKRIYENRHNVIIKL